MLFTILDMDDKLRDEVWKKDNSTCQKCKRKVTEIVNPFEHFLKDLSDLKEIPIFKWPKICWKCQKETPVVTYDLEAGQCYMLGDIEKLDKILMQKYPFVKRTFSKTMGQEVIANTCIHCGSLQGNLYIIEDLLKMAYEVDMNKLIDLVLPNSLTPKDLHIDIEELKPVEIRSSMGHIHHKDGNWENNDLDNLVLLCKDCHAKIHSQMGRNLMGVRSRKQARDETRSARTYEKEKMQAEVWRKNYYAQRKKTKQNTEENKRKLLEFSG